MIEYDRGSIVVRTPLNTMDTHHKINLCLKLLGDLLLTDELAEEHHQKMITEVSKIVEDAKNA